MSYWKLVVIWILFLASVGAVHYLTKSKIPNAPSHPKLAIVPSLP